MKPSNLFRNFGIKIFCLAAASVLWVYVAAGQNTIGKYPGNIKIKAMNVPSGYVALYDAKTVNIKVMADPTVWGKLSSDSFSAYIDLSNKSEGTFELPVTVISSTPGVQIVERTPDRIIVKLEQIISKEVEVRPKVEGSAGEGLIAGNISLAPDKSTVRGAKSIVSNLTEAYALIRLNGESDKFEHSVNIVGYDESGIELSDIEFSPSSTNASVSIVKASNNKTVGVKVATVGKPKTGYYISNIAVTPNVVDIVGQPNILSDVNYIETLPIDLTDRETSFELDTALNLKNSISLQAGVPAKFRVKISLTKGELSRELSITINYLNIPDGYIVSGLAPSEVKVICSGDSDIVGKLKSSDLTLTLDFKDKKVSENAGTSFTIPLSSIKAPSGIIVNSVVPSAIIVSMSRK